MLHYLEYVYNEGTKSKGRRRICTVAHVWKIRMAESNYTEIYNFANLNVSVPVFVVILKK